ncbi:hypothetical protein E4U60_005375 [Claviceps pazoutovae]|uniref:Kinetochore protein mis13 n=1 Tax=Claviceps pazoutovae TaxID=1649127 RepID=A0A9P7MHT4_9HYPO|nr:hypothetical protein E4U60_005375 [Claviceps pazoutovae]
MTTLVATQQVLELHSMSNQQERRRSKRHPAAPSDFERDDDFQFVRKSKRLRTEETPAAPAAGSSKRATNTVIRTLPAATIPENEEPEELSLVANPPVSKSTSRTGQRKTRQSKASEGSPPHEEPPPPLPPQPQPKPRGRTTRNSTRGAAVDKADRSGTGEDVHANGAAKRGAAATASSSRTITSTIATTTAATSSKPVRKWEPSPTPRRPVESSKISLPMNDTPIINRNKEMRKKGGKSNRRSSLGSRGRRASSLIDNGQTAIPHREVEAREFYKHIAEDLPEPRRMKQLLMWCGERAMPERRRGKGNSEAVLSARAIQDQILKDFTARSECSNWFDRDDDAPPSSTAVPLPNPRNIELADKLVALEAKIQRLHLEKQAWQAIREPPPDIPPVYPEDATPSSSSQPDPSQPDPICVLPEISLLEPDEAKTRKYLTDELVPFPTLLSQTETRIRTIQASLEFEIDQLADNVHKLQQRVLVAGKQADAVLGFSARMLKERERRDRERAGTREMPLMEVLRGLSGMAGDDRDRDGEDEDKDEDVERGRGV